MVKGLASLLLFAAIAWGQRPRGREAPPAPRMLWFEAVATEAGGHPVSDLAPSNLELVRDGAPQEITHMIWYDPLRHSSKVIAKTSQQPDQRTFELAPEEIRRNFVFVVDDLGLTSERAQGLQVVLSNLIAKLAPEDHAAILRTSSGCSREQQLGAARRALAAQIARIQPVGGTLSPPTLASANWQAIRWALEGLYAIPGRKAVVLISEHLDAPLTHAPESDFVRKAVASLAHAGMAVFYTVDPRAPAEPPAGSNLAWLIQETGGMAAPNLDAVMRDQEGFYLLGFRGGQPGASPTPPVLQIRGRMARLRWRFGFVGVPARHGPVPLDRATAVQRSQSSGADGGDLRLYLSPLFVGYARAAAVLDIVANVDLQDLSDIRDLKGVHSVSAEPQIAVYGDFGRVSSPMARPFAAALSEEEFQKRRAEGLIFDSRINVATPGGYQVRAMVADGLSDRAGSCMQFLEIPDISKGQLAVSSLLLSKPVEGANSPPAEHTVLSRRAFRAGTPIAFSYAVINALVGPAKESKLEVATHIYATGRNVYDGRPVQLSFAEGVPRQISSRLQLDVRLPAGEYVIEVVVTDLLAKDGAPRVASQFVTFEVQE